MQPSKSPDAPSNPQPKAPQQPPVPTMTSASLIPPLEPPPTPQLYEPAPELAEDIVAKPLGAPDFAQDIKPYLANPNLWPRWIFTDRRRYSQAIAQGWRNAKVSDFKPGFAKLNPFSAEGGTKFINGDSILMLIDRKIYLGALKYKHQVAAGLSDTIVQRKISAQKGQAAMGPVVNAVNRAREAQGKRPLLEVFAPTNDDVPTPGVLANPSVSAKELGRIGEAGRDMGSLADMAQAASDAEPNQ